MAATDAKIVQITKEVTDKLRDTQWSMRFVPVRVYSPRKQLEDVDQLTVQVVMAAIRTDLDSRADWPYECDIDIGVMLRAKPNSGDATEKFDACLKLTEEIADYWKTQRPTITDMPLISVAFGAGGDQPYIPDHIENFNQFTGVVRLTFAESP